MHDQVKIIFKLFTIVLQLNYALTNSMQTKKMKIQTDGINI